MSSSLHLSEHANNVLLALELARKEKAHLQYSCSTLFALTIDLHWVENLSLRPELAEKLELQRLGVLKCA